MTSVIFLDVFAGSFQVIGLAGITLLNLDFVKFCFKMLYNGIYIIILRTVKTIRDSKTKFIKLTKNFETLPIRL